MNSIQRMLCVGAAALAGASTAAQSFPPGFESVPLPGSFRFLTGMVFAPDGTLFVLEKPGYVRIHHGNSLQSSPFLDLTAEVNNDHDRGLLGLALSPGFSADGGPASWVYVLYTVSPVPGSDLAFDQNDQYSFSRLARYRAVSAGGLLVADLASRQVLLGNPLPDGSVPDCIASLHNSHSNGSMRFARDGSLLIATGDGAHYGFSDEGGADPAGFDAFVHPQTNLRGPTPVVQDSGAFRSQDLRSLAGKILRIDPETGHGYPSNPFFDGNPTSHRSRVWALGLRNPFRMNLVPGTGASDPLLGDPGVLVIGDVGWVTYEELNLCTVGGQNFGWPCFEGFPVQAEYAAFDPSGPAFPNCNTARFGVDRSPALAWHHADPGLLAPPGLYVDEGGAPLPGFEGTCSIGGSFYEGGTYPAAYDGLYFFADYSKGWIKTLELDAAHAPVAVRDFATGLAPSSFGVVAIERDPLSGDLFYALQSLPEVGKIHRIRVAENLTPVCRAAAQPDAGLVPLAVAFDGSASFDPDDPPVPSLRLPGGGSTRLSFDWDFGDGSAHSQLPNPRHTYTQAGVYEATLTVTDVGGLSATDAVMLYAGDLPPVLTLLSPAPGQLVPEQGSLALECFATDPEGGTLAFEWQVDLHHDTHIHPGVFLSTQPVDAFPLDSHAEQALIYYRVGVTATDAAGIPRSAHAFVYSERDLHDVTGTAIPIARTTELVPPHALGGGNHDLEVLRDGVRPAPGSSLSVEQYDSFHFGDQGDDDWVGYELPLAPPPEFRFVALVFQEGIHFANGGWFEDLWVEVRQADGAWIEVSGASLTPQYPFGQASEPFFDHENFETYTIQFDPKHGDAIRLRGRPGGSSGFISVGELRVLAIRSTPEHAPGLARDLTAAGTIVAKVYELSPPGPIGGGSRNPETIRNGTKPPVGSSSSWAQFDTYHEGQQGAEDWIGYEYSEPQLFERLEFQEGRHFGNGGAFDALTVAVRRGPGGPWVPVSGLTLTPAYAGLEGDEQGYETFVLDFEPVRGHGIRIQGDPAGSSGFISVGELRVFGRPGPFPRPTDRAPAPAPVQLPGD